MPKFRLWSLILVLFVSFVGCDQLQEAVTSDLALSRADAAQMATNLSSELGLSTSSSRSVSQAFAKGDTKTPGYLWTVAKDLQSTLTAEEKAALLNPTIDPEATHPTRLPDSLKHRGKKGGKGGHGGTHGDSTRTKGLVRSEYVPYDLLTDAQKTQLQAILDKYAPLIEAIRNDTSLTHDQAHAKIAELNTAKQAEIAAILTEEQKTALAARIAEKEAARAATLAAEKEARNTALGIDAATSDKLDALYTARKDAMKAALAAVKAGTLTQEALATELQKVKDTFNAGVSALLNATQAEIVFIHEALHHRKPEGGKGKKG